MLSTFCVLPSWNWKLMFYSSQLQPWTVHEVVSASQSCNTKRGIDIVWNWTREKNANWTIVWMLSFAWIKCRSQASIGLSSSLLSTIKRWKVSSVMKRTPIANHYRLLSRRLAWPPSELSLKITPSCPDSLDRKFMSIAGYFIQNQIEVRHYWAVNDFCPNLCSTSFQSVTNLVFLSNGWWKLVISKLSFVPFQEHN